MDSVTYTSSILSRTESGSNCPCTSPSYIVVSVALSKTRPPQSSAE